jgi:hypothetical protein
MCFVALWAGVAAGAAGSQPRPPAYTISFTGSGAEHHLDEQQNIQDSGACNSAEHVDVAATLAWSAVWTGFRPAARTPLGRRWQTAGSTVQGSDVKDACGLPLDQAPPDWLSQKACQNELAVSAPPQVAVARKTAKALVLAFTAPSFAVPVTAQCSLNVRNDQLAGHVSVPFARLATLRKGQSLSLAVGTAHPGPGDGDIYAPSLDCSQPTKPYDGYRTADHCQDNLSWSGTLKLTRAS